MCTLRPVCPVPPVRPVHPVRPVRPVHPVRPVRPVLRRHIWLRLARPDTLLSTGFRLDTCN